MDRQVSEQNISMPVNINRAVNETRIRVRYAETDQMGVVYHSNHFIWFEVGRVELLRQLGFSISRRTSKLPLPPSDNCVSIWVLVP